VRHGFSVGSVNGAPRRVVGRVARRFTRGAIAGIFLAAAFVLTSASSMIRLVETWDRQDSSALAMANSARNAKQQLVSARRSLAAPNDARSLASVAKVKYVFANAGYTLDGVRDRKATVPRIQHAYLPHDLPTLTQARERKGLFLHFMLPYVLEANSRVETQRAHLMILHAKLKAETPLAGADVEWLAKLGAEYGVQSDDLAELLNRVDIMPPSLALAQSAVESGWGTSRFAQEGNAPFGQWTTNEYDGLVPRSREAGKTHKVRAYKTINDSVASYLRNLNTHRAYRKFREARAAYRSKGLPLDSLTLAKALKSYSETGDHYIKLLKQVIRGNNLTSLDHAQLGAEVVTFYPDV
jgi:Bax protein